MSNDNELLFDSSDDSELANPSIVQGQPWKVLIVDDEPEVHQITKLTLVNFNFENRGLEFLHAYSAKEARELIQKNPNIALTLLDVVMETNHAGLDLVQTIREELANQSIRIVLRTGQPGMAPERDIIVNYDINDYIEKAELSAQKLFTVIVASLRGYRDILKLQDSQKKLLLSNQQLVEQGERLQVTLDSIGDAVLTTDDLGNLLHLNPIAQALTGWSLAEARGKPLKQVFNIINASTRLPVTNPVENVLATGKILGLANHTVLISKDGTEYQIADSAAPIRNHAGDVLGVVMVFRDVTQEYLTEEALRRSQKMDAIGQLTGGIAHDFNNQLGIVIGYLEFLQEHTSEDEIACEWLGICLKTTLRCTDLTRQLLSFSRTKSSECHAVDINAQLNELKTMYARSVTPAIDVQYFLTENLWPTKINAGEFQDALLNLVLNARDAMPDGGKLLIETSNKTMDADYVALNPDSQSGEYVQIMLSDTGTGINKASQAKIFEPFYTTKASGHGTGLGLSMVYGFVKRFSGFIKIYSELGVGTTFRLYLPRAVSTETDKLSQPNDAMDIPIPSGNETILIVDDEVDLLHLAEKYLDSLGYRTLTAENAAQALTILDSNESIDLMFSDVVMPGGMNGYELAQQASDKNPHLKVLITSGFTSKTIAQNGLAKFANNLLSKPYRKAELAQRIRQVLDEALNT